MQTFRKFIQFYRPYKGVFIFDLICAAFISLVDLAYPQVLRTLTNTLFTRDPDRILHALPGIALVLLAAYILQALCKYYVSCQGHIMGAKMERDMRKKLFDQYEALSFSYYDRNNTGQMMSRLVSDLFDISEMAHHGPENLFISLVKIAGSFVFLFLIQKKLALLLLAVVILMTLVSAAQNRRMQATFLDNRRKIGSINATLQDSLSGIRIVQAFGNEKIEQAKFRRGNEAFLDSKRDNYRAMGTFQAGSLFFQGIMYLLVIAAGGYFVAKRQMSVGDLAMYSLYIGIFISPIQILVELTEMLQKGMSGFRRYLDVMETRREITDAPDAVPIADAHGDIVFQDVSFAYEAEEPVLSHLSFTVKSGESLALVGPSGGGKTTICSLIPRFYDVTGGTIRIGGQDIRKIRLESLRQSIGIVQQEVYMFSGTIRDNIAYGRPDASMEDIVEAAKKANVHEFVLSLPDGYDTFVGERGTRLSGGQKQRISIARIFLKNPPILILDEATSALDNESERYIQKSLDALAENRTTITIAHRLSTIRSADEILVIEGQGIAERGTHEELMEKNGIYARYYNLSK
ncbi:MAG: ABC transporter ATP-binding protein/permease [Lachnospiraceae bacterium]|jgi:ATP-binding cassette subfamily B protein|nr:ABC transporter ATP-binding protein/permease [Lachnospiraceae bacterium]MCI1657851.1 ABC transporter ATP-binding protein/permease [Lachnospiraceae bacterium]MCI2196222.1 ABC transporter ATP-binding protein/permease [Lachnospiraceae bacterium]